MKFRKEHQTYLLIVIAIITAGYFLKPFFFNKKKKVIEGQAGTTTTYYRVAFNSTDLSNLLNTLSTPPTPTQEDLLKQLILTQYNTVLTDNTTGIKYVMPDTKYGVLSPLIPATILMRNSTTGGIMGLKVATCTGNKLDFFNKEAAAAADTADATAAAAAYDYARYARLILSNDVNIRALIAAANLLTIIGQPDITNYTDTVVTTAKNAAKSAALAANSGSAAYAAEYADYAKDYAAKAAADAKTNLFYGLAEAGDALKAAEYAANAAGYADAYAMGLTLNATTVKLNDNYIKVMNKDNSTPANMKAAFITAAGLIYQSIYEKIKPPL